MKQILTILAVLLIMSGCGSSTEEKGVQELNAGEVLTKLYNENENSFLLYLTSDHCYSCDEFEKVIDELQQQEPFAIYKLHIQLEEEDENIQQQMQELNVTIGDIRELPMVYYIYQGNLLQENTKSGYQDKEVMEQWLKSLHILH